MPDRWVYAVSWIPVYLLAACLLFLNLRPAGISAPGVVRLLAVIALWPLVQLCTRSTIYAWNTKLALVSSVSSAATAWSAYYAFRFPAARRLFLRVLVAVGTILAVAGTLQLYTSPEKVFWFFDSGGRSIGSFGYLNQYAAFVELLLPVAVWTAMTAPPGWAAVGMLATVVMFGSVVASASRSGVILVGLEAVVVPWLAARRLGLGAARAAMPALLLIAMMTVIALAAGPEAVIQRLLQSNPYEGRAEFALSSIEMIRQRPLLGFGLGNWTVAYPAFSLIDLGLFINFAHNDWLQWAAEGGLPFALAMLALAAWSLRAGLRTVWGIGVTFVFLQCLTDSPLIGTGVVTVFFSFVGAMAASSADLPNRNNQRPPDILFPA